MTRVLSPIFNNDKGFCEANILGNDNCNSNSNLHKVNEVADNLVTDEYMHVNIETLRIESYKADSQITSDDQFLSKIPKVSRTDGHNLKETISEFEMVPAKESTSGVFFYKVRNGKRGWLKKDWFSMKNWQML